MHDYPEASAPAAADANPELQKAVDEVPFWYHRIELPGGIVTPGSQPLAPSKYRVPADLTGKRVLDIGAWDGFWAFEALKRGAREVVAIDDFSDVANFRDIERWPGWHTFDLCREALGYDDARCHRTEMSLYDLSEAKFGRFDIVFFFGVIYHCRYPLAALDRAASVCDSEIYIESAILDDFSPYRGGLGCGYPRRQFVMEFYPRDQYAMNGTNWWVPTLDLLGTMVLAAGFPRAHAWKLLDTPDDISVCRGFVKGERGEGDGQRAASDGSANSTDA